MMRGPLLADLAAIAIGGALGAVARHGLNRGATLLPGESAHWGTLAANVIGCLAIGCLAGWLSTGAALSERSHLAIRTGLLGGLTTFSTFTLETILLASQHRWATTAVYFLSNLLLGLLAVALGMLAGRHWLGQQPLG